MNQQFPCKILGHMEVDSVKGKLPSGFNIYWNKFLNETGTNDISVSLNDLQGEFNEKLYNDNYELLLYKKKDITKRPIVLFIQGLQGGGKSTMAHSLKNFYRDHMNLEVEVIEQDQFVTAILWQHKVNYITVVYLIQDLIL